MKQYKYYKEVISEEHMLFANEIAQKYNIYSVNNKPATMFVSSVLKDFIIASGEDQLMYQTVRGLTNVYPKRIYEQVMKIVYAMVESNDSFNKPIVLQASNKNFTIIIKKEEE